MLPREARDAAALAPAADCPRLDLPASPDRPTTAGQGPATADHPPAQRESSLGLPAHQGRTTAPRHPGVGHHDPHHHASSRVGSCASAGGYDLAVVPAPVGHRDHGLRLLHRRHDLAAAVVCAVLHRAGHSTSSGGRGDRPPRWRLGCPAGSQPAADARESRTAAAVSDPRPGYEVHPSLRRRLPVGRRQCPHYAGAGAQRQRPRGALDPDGAGRVPGLAAAHRTQARGAGCCESTSTTTTSIVRTERSGWNRRIHQLVQPPSARLKGVCTAATASAGCSARTTDKLHERVSAPYGSPTRARAA